MICFLVSGTVLRPGSAALCPRRRLGILTRSLRFFAVRRRYFATISCHVALMFFKGPGEDVPALVVGDKIERVPGGIKRRADGGFSRSQ